ncbi:hypothetical protein CYY_003605 [Polysphondylium violaceum]|uniref:Phosphatidylinositol 3-kinase n=1 Tax=Polysphondylium violaceum TaxID=133409 RepID=A0A8J4PWI0_9MYCE|nr:hypothetical protein CYY_003605 [Polysphondylium violaceum]
MDKEKLQNQYNELLQRKTEALNRYETVENNIVKLYNAVKIDKLKRNQEKENLENEIKEQRQIIETINDNLSAAVVFYSNEKIQLQRMIDQEDQYRLKLEMHLKELNEKNAISSNPHHPQNLLKLNRLREIQTNYHGVDKKLQDLFYSSKSKESHLQELIDNLQLKLNHQRAQVEEYQNNIRNQKELENLLSEIEQSQQQPPLAIDDENEVILRHINDDINSKRNSSRNGTHSPPTLIDPNTFVTRKNLKEEIQKQRQVELKELEDRKEREIQLQLQLEKEERDKLVQIEREKARRKETTTIQYPVQIEFVLASFPMYAINVVDNVIAEKSIQFFYSLEQDTVFSLKSKIYQHLLDTDMQFLILLDIKHVDDLSLKTSFHFYFPNEPKEFLKYNHYFSNNHKNGAFKLYIVSKDYQDQFYSRLELMMNNNTSADNEQIVNKEESNDFRNRIMLYLDDFKNDYNILQKHVLENQYQYEFNISSSPLSFSPNNSQSSLPNYINSNNNSNSGGSSLSNSFNNSINNNNNNSNNNINNSPKQLIIGSNRASLSSPASPLLYSSSPSLLGSFKDFSLSPTNSSPWRTYKKNNSSPSLRKLMVSGSGNSSSNLLNNINQLNQNQNCTIRLYITNDIIKTFVCSVSSNIGEVQDIIFKKFMKIILSKEEKQSFSPDTSQSSLPSLASSPSSLSSTSLSSVLTTTSSTTTTTPNDLKSKYVIKIRGLEIYLTNPFMNLSSIDFINTKSRRQKKIDLLLLDKSSIDPKIITNSYDYPSKIYDSMELESLQEVENESRLNQSYQSTKRFKLRVGGIKNFEYDQLKSLIGISVSESMKIYVRCQIYQCELAIGSEMVSPRLPLTSNPTWLAWIEGPPIKDIPSNAILSVYVKLSVSKNEDIVIAWVNYPIWNYKNCINSGFSCLPLWTNSKPTSSMVENKKIGVPNISFEVDLLAQSIVFASIPYQSGSSAIDSLIEQSPDNMKESTKLSKIIDKSPLSTLKPQEKELVWKYRNYLKNIPKSIPKVILSVPWDNPASVTELYHLLEIWPSLDPVDCLELLSSNFLDRKVRKFAIFNLTRMSDTELSLYLPQLLQAIKHEPHHYSTLTKFVLRRVLLNRQYMAHLFFWQVKAEIASLLMSKISQEWLERYILLLESFLRGCGENFDTLYNQCELYTLLKNAAIGAKALTVNKRKDYLAQVFEDLPDDFVIPVNPELRGRGIDVSLCKLKESKTMPLFLHVQNYDPQGDNILTIFKAGDDLRQDQLTLQMIDLMDKIWLAEGIDLLTVSYKCIATGPEEGMIEVVGESITIAEIQKLYGGATAAFSATTISSWLKQENPSEFEYNTAVENFVKTCAGCCVYSFILGIGDRHNDNIMVTKSGHLFHIDFGRFLGNVQTFHGIKRERSPFVFPPSFAHIIKEKNNFKAFEDLCGKAYNAIRKKANVFLNLFLMMISTGMPELSQAQDIYYLRDALALELTNEQASEKFSKMIQESVSSLATDVNFAIHILANPN